MSGPQGLKPVSSAALAARPTRPLRGRAFARAFQRFVTALKTLRQKCSTRQGFTSAAEADSENNPFIGAVNRCATQNPGQYRPDRTISFGGWIATAATILLVGASPRAQQAAPTDSIGPAPAAIVAPRPNYAFPDGRSYVYSAEWHLITAGIGVVRMDVAGNERKVTATAESSGAVNVLFPVHDRFESRFDPRTFCSLSIFKHSEEGSHKRETSIHFAYWPALGSTRPPPCRASRSGCLTPWSTGTCAG